ncbi:glyoxalase [Plantactinospora sp. BC1]|uniref:VOC family protein n=1 Tax=Plantactinospora sp. BC1 TaxID=2108470 RepID=UPI000D16E092|nr:VOC family protein [Plantactinospora sp. BC1]AVT28550.1 glyoxalase [Plantactinospora sp. BC1]
MTPRLDAFGLVVADMARSLTFYRKLGLDVPASADTQPHAEYALPGGVRLMWDTVEMVRSLEPDWSPPGGSQISLAFRCADPAEVDSVYAEMTAAGHEGHLKPWDAPWGQRYAVLRDPDGNGVDLYAPLAPAAG